MYIRFTEHGTYLSLRAGDLQVQTKGLHNGHYLSALSEEILPQIPGMVVEQRHQAWFVPFGSETAEVHTCALAEYMNYGGEDVRHGWDCFRDLDSIRLRGSGGGTMKICFH